MRVALSVLVALASCAEGGVAWPRVPAPDGPVPIADRAAARLPAPTYHADVAPIFAARCVSCHDDGGIAPFSLRSYDTSAAQAIAIAWVVEHRIMPPWPADASGACGTLRNVRRLSDAEITILTSWADAGAPEGDPDDAVVLDPPTEPAFERSAELISPEAYAVEPGADQYRCFVTDPGIAEDRFITAYRVRVDRSDVVHHMQLFAIDDPGQEQLILNQDRRDSGPGFACAEEGIGGSVRYVGVWAQGEGTRRWPDATGVRIAGGRRVVLQIHYHPVEVTVTDRTAVELQLAPQVEREGRFGGVGVNGFELPPRMRDVQISAESRIAQLSPLIVRGVRLHMHTLGTRARLELVRSDMTECLLDIPRWDFEWQLFYDLDRPIAVERRDALRVSCAYDTSSRREPVMDGLSTDDEMCIGYVYVTDP